MSINPLLILTLFALVVAWVFPKRGRISLLLIGSLVSIFALQPSLAIRNLDFWLPTTSILLVIFVWAIIYKPDLENLRSSKSLLLSGLVIVSVVLTIALTRYLEPLCCLTPSRPPQIGRVAIFLIAGGCLAILPIILRHWRRQISFVTIILIIGIFIILKSPALSQSVSAWLREVNGQSPDLATPQDIVWFGFSFLAFRLLHVLLDYRSGKLPTSSLEEFVTYAIFFPALPAGPIDRLPRFIGDLHQSSTKPVSNTILGAWRILLGLFKKFVIADSLALIALNSVNAGQVVSPYWMWLLLYAYALRIYFDFSGYTDVALGLGRLVGFQLPENFNRPYLKTNLTAFWNSWHITLAQWFRSYYFFPFTRMLRTRFRKLPTWFVILLSQFTTMLLIGIWHGITWNFVIWGAWHGVGLFVHNRWAEWMRPRQEWFQIHSHWQRTATIISWFITFNYVTLGWVWFALPSLDLSVSVFQKLFGV